MTDHRKHNFLQCCYKTRWFLKEDFSSQSLPHPVSQVWNPTPSSNPFKASSLSPTSSKMFSWAIPALRNSSVLRYQVASIICRATSAGTHPEGTGDQCGLSSQALHTVSLTPHSTSPLGKTKAQQLTRSSPSGRQLSKHSPPVRKPFRSQHPAARPPFTQTVLVWGAFCWNSCFVFFCLF